MTHAAADSSSRGSTTDVRGLGVGQYLGPVVHDVHVEVDDFEGAHQEHHERAVDYPCRQGGRRVLANWRTKNVKRESDCLACWNEGVWGQSGQHRTPGRLTHHVRDEGGAEQEQVKVQVDGVGKSGFVRIEEPSARQRGPYSLPQYL